MGQVYFIDASLADESNQQINGFGQWGVTITDGFANTSGLQSALDLKEVCVIHIQTPTSIQPLLHYTKTNYENWFYTNTHSKTVCSYDTKAHVGTTFDNYYTQSSTNSYSCSYTYTDINVYNRT